MAFPLGLRRSPFLGIGRDVEECQLCPENVRYAGWGLPKPQALSWACCLDEYVAPPEFFMVSVLLPVTCNRALGDRHLEEILSLLKMLSSSKEKPLNTI